ncbi:hypothetical protein [Pseudomonas alabamensis]|uniref:hypothetical protein n=1 Tax=Pseudomonas alabamensis TaxID=3064349 RepID=UPI0021DB6BCC|nr:hypothetical protein [Pseudomonas entomophila]
MSMSSAESISGSSSGPSVVAFITVADLNRLWAERYASQGRNLGLSVPVIAEREMAGNTWELSVVRLGYPNMQFDTSRHSLTVSRRLLTDLRVYLTESSGMSIRQAFRIEQSGADGDNVLQVTLELQDLHMEYHTAKSQGLYVHWSKPAVYVIEQDRLSASKFRQHFEPLKQMRLTTLSAPLALALHYVRIYYKDYDATLLRPAVQASFRYSRVDQEARPSQSIQSGAALLWFNIDTFPRVLDGMPPLDRHWITSLFAPSGSMKWSAGDYPGGQYYLGGYTHVEPTSALAKTQLATPVCDLMLTPLVTFSDAGGGPIEFESLSYVDEVRWRPEGGRFYGMFRPHGSKCRYTPPVALKPAVRFNQAGDTLIPAAYRSSLSTPTITEVISAKAQDYEAYVSIVVRWVYPTHFIRVAKHTLSELKLSLCYLNRDQKEIAVPDSQISWHVVAGNGSVSSGVFKTAESDPSAYSVVIGIDESRQDEWRWGMTIIALPMLDIDTLVEAYSR